jgi:ABC-type antimicrobial peptide transport system permease subunit
MFAIIGATLFAVVTIMTLLVACGLPLGEFTMGGQHKVLPKKYRIMAVFSLAIQVFAIIIILQVGGYIPLWFSASTSKYVCIFFAAYLSLNTVMNLSSKSKKERYAMTPLSLFAATCFWLSAFSM